MQTRIDRWKSRGMKHGLLAVALLGSVCPAHADDAPATPAASATDGSDKSSGDKTADKPAAEEEAGMKRLDPKFSVWIDTKRKGVVIDGEVCLREGQLEMLACPKGTKEHESVIACYGPPYMVHAALEAIGAKAGTAVKFDPEYVPATGPTIDIYLVWKDEKGKVQNARAQQWIKNVKTEKAMDFDWVFSGSGFWKDEETGKEHYRANGGDFICVSNFPTATIDLPVKSSQANNDLLFSAFTENIPPRGTKVRMLLVPRVKKDGEKASDEKATGNKATTDEPTDKTGAKR